MSVQEMKNKSTVIGLTGGIACGKSMISAYLAQKGIPVIDGDLVARQIVEPGTKGLAQIVDTFGAEYLHADGTLNRAMLGSRVFADKEALQQLNAITKPLLLEAFKTQINALQAHPMIVLDVALLLEDHDYKELADQVWVVTVSPVQQLARLMKRNSYTAEEAQNRINAQMSNEERIQYADVVIDNNGTMSETIAQVDRLLYNILIGIQ
ncbi:MAG: dephospho-CoA kinase [Peptococcaceae bacterium]|jgi:dephospho-CoA kinase|nr:dephospho-CoA kinase [Peptococcaceae bacterium]